MLCSLWIYQVNEWKFIMDQGSINSEVVIGIQSKNEIVIGSFFTCAFSRCGSSMIRKVTLRTVTLQQKTKCVQGTLTTHAVLLTIDC